MKKMLTLLIAFVMVLSSLQPVYAAEGKVTYDGGAKKFIFAPGSDESITDLFPDFKGVMPGDTLVQKITVKNDASDKVKVKIYLRALGAHPESQEFLSQLRLAVGKDEGETMSYMFDAMADETAQLADWVCLGTLYSGGEVNLEVGLQVPVELGNEFQSQIGYLDWEFKVEEFPAEPDDPTPPKTGDDSNPALWWGLMAASGAMMIALLTRRKKEEER